MKEKIIIFIIGLLAGAVLATGGFLIYTKTNNNSADTNKIHERSEKGRPGMNGEQPPEMPDGERPDMNGEEPPEKPTDENEKNTDESSNKSNKKSKKTTTDTNEN